LTDEDCTHYKRKHGRNNKNAVGSANKSSCLPCMHPVTRAYY
jgi:hypothetical protein